MGKPENLIACWKILEDLKDEGVIKSIGVSNFQPKDLEAVLKVCKHKPVVNQIEFHPYVLEHLEPLLALQKQHGIITEAFGGLTPIARGLKGPLTPVLEKIAKRLATESGKKVDTSAVLIKWLKANQIVCVTMSTKEERIMATAENGLLPDLTEEEVEEISTVGKSAYFRFYDTLMTDIPLTDAMRAKKLDGEVFVLKL